MEIEFDEFILIDTPGLNDPKMSTADWSTRYNNSSATSNSAQIALILLVFKCSQRPSRDDANNINVLQQVVNEIKPDSCAVVFTFADTDEEMDRDLAAAWYGELIEGIENMPAITEEQVFLFKGKGSNATTSEELQTWV